jgi:hypothetical protein
MYQAPPPPRRSNTAWVWAIVGVIVVCGCGGIGLLGAILFPVFLQAKQSAIKTQCISNLKRASLAMIMYTVDADDHFPSASAWIDKTQKYDAVANFYDCPAVKVKGGQYGYAMSAKLGGKPAVDVARPYQEIMLFETGNLKRNASGDPKVEAFPNRHGPGRTEAYADGHTKWIRSD